MRVYWLAGIAVGAALIVAGAFLPKFTGPISDTPINPAEINVTDGDTIKVRGAPYRLVGFDTPETSRAKCGSERQLGDQATVRLQAIINMGNLTLQETRCSCSPGTIGTRWCNFGRRCGILKANGENIGTLLIREGLARPFVCGEFRCPRLKGWC
jgi:endonuclease YncB( thermonuclease family)